MCVCGWVYVCARVCVCVIFLGALVGQLVKSGLTTQRTLVRIPGQEGKKKEKGPQEISLQPTSPPICKTGTWPCAGVDNDH